MASLSFTSGIVLMHLGSFPQNGRLAIANYLSVWEMGILLKGLTARCLPSKEESARMTWEICQEDPSGIEPESLCEELDCPHVPPSHEEMPGWCSLNSTTWEAAAQGHQRTFLTPAPRNQEMGYTGVSGASSCSDWSSAALYHLSSQARREGLLFPLYTAWGAGLTLPRPISNGGGSNPDHPSPG